MEVKYIHLISKYVSKPFVFFKQRKLAISSDTPSFYTFIQGTVFIKLWEITFPLFTILKCWHILDRTDFQFQNLIYFPNACVRKIYENVTFVIGKLNFVSYQFVLSAFPP